MPAPCHVMLAQEKNKTKLIHFSGKKNMTIPRKKNITEARGIKCFHHIVITVYFTIFVSAIQENGEDTKHLPFVTEASDVEESVLKITEHTDSTTLRHILNLATKSLSRLDSPFGPPLTQDHG